MFDRGLTAHHNIKDQEKKLTDGRWRLMQGLCHYSSPWKKYTMEEVVAEYGGKADPCSQYIHHFLKRYEGEVAFGWEEWAFSASPLPRDAELWNQQYASSESNYAALGKLERHVVSGNKWDEQVIGQSTDLTKVGNTNIIMTKAGQDGHWHAYGGAISLAELFDKFGEKYTVAELFLWYYQAPKVCRKRQQAWGHPDVRAASWQRYLTYGRRGHRD